MKKNNFVLKGLFSLLLIWCLFSVTFAATTQQWREILNKLRNQWRTDEEIKAAIEDLWYSADEYFPKNSSSTKTTTTYTSSSTNYNSKGTTQQWRNILNELKKEWRTDEEIKVMMEDLWLDTSWYFPNSSRLWSSEWVYTSRSCKVYNIQYLDSLEAYTSPDLKKTEYFISSDYLKRYIDSKNPQANNCPINEWRISTFYTDSSNRSDRFIAPNWKIYFISYQNWSYTSNDMSKAKSFWAIYELKNYIRERNPLIRMWNSSGSSKSYSNTSSAANNSLSNIWNEIFN
jgi:uncharacterized protein (DUF1697 family)